MTFTSSVETDRRRDPASADPWATNERRWPGRRPSGAPEAPARKDMIAFLTSSSVATAGTTESQTHQVGRKGYGFLGPKGAFPSRKIELIQL